MKLSHTLLGLLIVSGIAATATARDIHVNNLTGDDVFDGSSSLRTSQLVGPVRTLRRAMRLARYGDRVLIANTNSPYYESLSLTGDRHSGNSTVPFRTVGNGATLSGARHIPASAWRQHDKHLWSFEPYRKGHYLLLLDGQPVERFETEFDQALPTGLEEGRFAVCRGRVFYQAAKNEVPAALNLLIAQDTTGISLYGVSNVVIDDLNVEHFRIDGLNAHDLCRSVLVRGVTTTSNGRSGVTVAGSSSIILSGCKVERNQKSSLRLQERGQAEVDNSELDSEPLIVNSSDIAR